MANLKLTQLSTSEFKLDCIEDFALNGNGNCMSIIGSCNEVTFCELKYSCDTMLLMPFSIKQIPISNYKPISKVLKGFDFDLIYETPTVHESHELALDLIYTADSSMEPLNAKVLQADILTIDQTSISCILTTYGYCEIFKKDAITEEWKSLETNLANILISEVFPLKISPSQITTFNALKAFANKFIITCFAMSIQNSQLIIYLGTAAGYIITLKYDNATNKFELYCSLKTSLNSISYITKFKHFILAACNDGKVLLLKVNKENYIQEVQLLWSTADNMACRKAVFTYCELSTFYFVIFCKASHILAYCLNMEGAVLCSSTLYGSGNKITGIDPITKNEFMITTVAGLVKQIKILCPTKEKLSFEEQKISHEFDTTNYQIMGLASSVSRNLWSFLLYRNKDIVHQSKYSCTTAFVNVCKLSSQDSFNKLIHLHIKNMDLAQDLIMGVVLDIFTNMEMNKYMDYLNLEQIILSDEINDTFLQQLQIKSIITRKLAKYQKIKYKKVKAQTKSDLQIILPILQLLHILGRLRYLKQQSFTKNKLSTFQELTIACMQSQFSYLLTEMAAMNNSNDEGMTSPSVVEHFLEFFQNEFVKHKFDTCNFGQMMEYCTICNQEILTFTKCEQGHEIKRCIISCTQLSLFKTKYCPHCFVLANNDEASQLEELYASSDYITCIYCRFLFKYDEF